MPLDSKFFHLHPFSLQAPSIVALLATTHRALHDRSTFSFSPLPVTITRHEIMAFPPTVLGVTAQALDSMNPDNDICPVCKTMRYLNRDMQFLINPECYHPMCSTCVNRIFNDGPNQCPYAGCHKTLRRRGFRPPYFSDLAVEREVDIRKRVATVFNKAEDDFETLDSYNEYLEMVENLTFSLVNGPELERKAAETKLIAYEQAHKAQIERNKRKTKETEERAKKKAQADQELARQKRMQEIAQEREERSQEKKLQEEMLDRLATAKAGEAEKTISRIILKKRGQAKVHDALLDLGAGADVANFAIRGLKVKKVDEDESKPYDPFGGLDLAPTRYAMGGTASYRNEWVDIARNREDMRTGGYCAEEYLSRALFEAFSGLGVFIEEERGLSGSGNATTSAALAAKSGGESAGGMSVDDVF
jgi:CDK-activating kinase assembly factor MAT1